MDIVRSDQGKRAMDQVRELVDNIREHSRQQIALQRNAIARDTESFHCEVLGAVSVATGLLLLSGITIAQPFAQRRKAEAELSATDAGFRSMADTVPSMLLSARPDGYQTFLSTRWTEHSGMTLESSRGDGWLTAVHPDEYAAAWQRWQAALKRKQLFDMSFRLRRLDGVYHWMLAKIVPVLNQNDELMQWCGAITDIHQYKVLEERLKGSNEDLEHFAYAASHDLQEPLRGITIWAQLLLGSRKTTLTADDEELFTSIISSAKRMSTMLKGLLEYARLEAHDQADAMVKINMESALRAALGNLQIAIAEANGEVTHDSLPEVLWLETPAVQIFQNLIGNSIKYRRPSVPPLIHVSCTSSDDEVTFSICDNGLGMRNEDVEMAFWIFKRLHQDPSNEGAGLGLAFCKRLVERRRGRIWAESEPGNGSTFYFSVPRSNTVEYEGMALAVQQASGMAR